MLETPITKIKSIGEKRALLFHKLGLYTYEDVLYYFPREYEDRTNIKKINSLVPGESCSFIATVYTKVSVKKIRRNLSIYKLKLKDETGTISAVWYNQHYIKNLLIPGKKYMFFGKIEKSYSGPEVQNPIFEEVSNNTEQTSLCGIVPVYPSTARLTQNLIRSVVKSVLESTTGTIPDILPESIRKSYNLAEINYTLQNIHFPKSFNDYINARYRLVFEELLILQLGLLSIKNALQSEKEGILFPPCPEMEDFIFKLPFKLTNAQLRAFSEIEKDMESKHVMNRLVQGDVGSGKTVVAILALFKAAKSGYQGALMVPTEILANQHFSTIAPMMKRFGINCCLLTGSLSKKQKLSVLESIKDGTTQIVIGTHALLEDNVEFNKLGLVVTDEQHRFGVRQRATLSKKGINPDMLVMTATPIPRTLALILYGDLDISIIDELPPGRTPVKTYAVDNSMRERINNFIRKQVSEGRQVYIVCPLVEESENFDAASATELAEKIASVDFHDLRVGMIHGKMKPAEKDEIMTAFAAGKIDILVSTTVIEVGVNVPNATLMVIENAERFGLAQLHQLRGRVGRGSHQSYCILYNNSNSKVSRERMKVMKETNDGFVISEKDLEIRGPGEFFGTRQHGLPELKIANLYKDMKVLKTVQELALKIIKNDSLLENQTYRELKNTIDKKFGEKIKILSFN